MSRTRAMRALVAACVALAALAIGPAAQAQSTAPPPPPAAPDLEKPGALSARLTRVQEVHEARSRGERPLAADPLEVRGPGAIARRADGAPLVYVRVEPGAEPQVIEALSRRRGVDVVHEADGVLTVHVPPAALSAVAATDGVVAVSEAHAPITRCGNAVSEGDTLMGAANARATGVDGTGVTVGVLSDSFNQASGVATTASQDVASGDLPGTGSPCGSTTPVALGTSLAGGGRPATDEGRAMAQIVHDLAPGADLSFGSASNGFFEFADEIRSLAAAGADVLVDDIGYLEEPFFQQGPIGVAVEEVVAGGTTYVSAIGNDRLTVGGRDIGAYETPGFRATACTGLYLPPDWDGLPCHDMRAGTGADPTWQLTVPANSQLVLDMQWNEPWAGVTTDFDILVFDEDGNAINGAVEDNLGSGLPLEVLVHETGAQAETVRIAVIRYAGANPRFKWVHLGSEVTASEYTTVAAPDVLGPGTAYGHPTSPAAIGVGAANFSSPTTPAWYSSRGPVTNYWAPALSLSSPAAPIAPQVVPKPDVAGIDGVANTFFGQPDGTGTRRFYGTSAAAPHVAAVAALALEANPALTPDDVAQILADTAVPLSSGDSTQWGAGMVNAAGAVDAARGETTRQSQMIPVAPARLLDTRTGVGVPAGKPAKDRTVEFQVTGRGGVPTSATAVVLTITATDATNPGFVTVHPGGIPRPLSANLNLEAKGQTISNQVVVALPPSGRVATYTQSGTHLVADVVGYYGEVDAPVAPGRFVPLAPARLLDTRNGTGYAGPKPASGQTVTVQTGGVAGVPSTASGVVLNVTATDSTGPGYVTIHPADIDRPLAANLTIERSGQTIGSHATVGLSDTGAMDLFVSRSSHLVADVVGYFTSEADPESLSGLYVPVTPSRLLDTRTGNGYVGSKPVDGQTLTLQLSGRSPVPGDGVLAAVLNLTAVSVAGPGYVTLYPADVPRPTSSSLNVDRAGQVRPNLVTSGVSAAGAVSIYTHRSAHLVGDVAGYYVDGTQPIL